MHANGQGRTVVLAGCESGGDHEGGDVSSTCGRIATVALSLRPQLQQIFGFYLSHSPDPLLLDSLRLEYIN